MQAVQRGVVHCGGYHSLCRLYRGVWSTVVGINPYAGCTEVCGPLWWVSIPMQAVQRGVVHCGGHHSLCGHQFLHL